MIARVLAAAAMLLAVSSCGMTPAFARGHHHHRAAAPICDNIDVMRPCQAEPARQTRRAARERVALARTVMRTPERPTHHWASVGFGLGIGNNLVERARAYIGRTGPSLGLPARLWCADFMNMLTGGGTGSRLAKSYLSHPQVSAQVGAIVVTSRRGGGHVGIVSGFTAAGDPIVVSGNHGRRVGEGVIPRWRVIAFVSP